MADARTIDELDRRIVQRLWADGREPNRSLAEALEVNEATVASRLKRLEATNAMRVVAVTDMEAFGYKWFAIAFIGVADRNPMEVSEEIAKVRAVISVSVTTGAFGVIAIMIARTREELGHLIGEVLPAVPGVGSIRCEFAIDVLRYSWEWATLSGAGGTVDGPGPELSTSDVIDEVDLHIIQALQEDARASHRSIAARTDVSEGTIRGRARRLEADGLVRIRAVCDVEAFGLGAPAIVGVHVRDGRVEEAGRKLSVVPGVGAIARTLGWFDYVLFVLSPSHLDLLNTIFEDVQGLESVRATENFEIAATHKHVFTWVRLVDRPS